MINVEDNTCLGITRIGWALKKCGWIPGFYLWPSGSEFPELGPESLFFEKLPKWF